MVFIFLWRSDSFHSSSNETDLAAPILGFHNRKRKKPILSEPAPVQ